MATFNRFDICYAHQALENDWNRGGWLSERPSNRRRRESTGCQLARVGFSSPYQGGSFSSLLEFREEFENAIEIYIERLVDFGLAKRVDPHDDLGEFIVDYYVEDYVAKHFPQLRRSA